MKKQETNILVIEDHDASRHLLGVMLSKRFQVATKKDGLEGLAWLSYGNFPDLIILDIQMPRMDGFEFLKGIKNSGIFREIPIIVLSASDNKEMKDYFHAQGIDDFIAKPFNPLALLDKINAILAKQGITV